MTLVRIIKDWDYPPLLRQAPANSGFWGGIRFTEDAVEDCDYVVVLNRSLQDVTVRCAPENVWAVIQEPPNEVFKSLHRGQPGFARVYMQDEQLSGPQFILSQPALPWHICRSYDELVRTSLPEKARGISCITSNARAFEGHRQRLSFVETIRASLDFDLYGRGFQPVADKWDALAPYRYSIVIENFRNSYYWSEKIADCLLAGTIPFYYGCTRIHDYFPPEVVVPIDIENPAAAAATIQKTVSSNLWHSSRDALDHSRNLILHRYQIFPFLSEEIKKNDALGSRAARQLIRIAAQPDERPRWLQRRTRQLVHLAGRIRVRLSHPLAR
jgi:Glycosyltransferase family 10 (fucosyltransferase) C-term